MKIKEIVLVIQELPFTQELKDQGYTLIVTYDAKNPYVVTSCTFEFVRITTTHCQTIWFQISGTESTEKYWFRRDINIYLGHFEVAELSRQSYLMAMSKDYKLNQYATIQSFVSLPKNELTTFQNETQINQSIDLTKVEEELRFLVENSAFKFFNAYENLTVVDKEIDRLEKEGKTLSDFLPGMTPFKMLIIRKLCNNPKYSTYLEEQKYFYRHEVFKYQQHFKDHDKWFEALLLVLEKTPPQYNV